MNFNLLLLIGWIVVGIMGAAVCISGKNVSWAVYWATYVALVIKLARSVSKK
jgi:hypothetical protein